METEYPHYNKMLRMLQVLSQAEEQLREQHPEQSQLRLSFFLNEAPAQLLIGEIGLDVADAVGISGGEAISLLNELAADDYIDLTGKGGFDVNVGLVTVVFRQKGRAALMEIPDPNAELARRLEAIATATEKLQGVDPKEKEHAAAAARELKTFGRGLAPPAAIELAKNLPTILGLGA